MLCSTNLKCANDVRKTCINESVSRKVSVRSGRCKHSATGIRNDDPFCHATKQYPEVLLACLAAGAACHLSTRKQASVFAVNTTYTNILIPSLIVVPTNFI